MRLTNKTPPGGYYYFDPRLAPWRVAPRSALALAGLADVAAALAMVRAQNPTLGLDSSLSACVAEVTRFTCERFPVAAQRMRYCVDTAQVVQMVQTENANAAAGIRPIKQGGGGCASCGGRRRK